MPSLIGSTGPDGTVNTGVAANYRRQQVPFSRFGTRKVAWFAIRHADTQNLGHIDMVKFNTIVDAIQTQMEIVMIGAPYLSDNWGKFMIAVFEDTMNDGANTDPSGYYTSNANSKTLQQVLQDVTGDNVIVERFYLFGAPSTGTNEYYGFSDSDTYQEYNFQGDYVANSYLNPNGL